MAQPITVQQQINVPLQKVWSFYNDPLHITNWNNASPEWHTPSATNDLRVGGSFNYRMEAKDGSMGFDFEGIYDHVEEGKLLSYTMSDQRKVNVHFIQQNDNQTVVTVTFDAEHQNPIEFQQAGWQSILDNFKRYCESTN